MKEDQFSKQPSPPKPPKKKKDPKVTDLPEKIPFVPPKFNHDYEKTQLLEEPVEVLNLMRR